MRPFITFLRVSYSSLFILFMSMECEKCFEQTETRKLQTIVLIDFIQFAFISPSFPLPRSYADNRMNLNARLRENQSRYARRNSAARRNFCDKRSEPMLQPEALAHRSTTYLPLYLYHIRDGENENDNKHRRP